jgi:poly(A) polymerase/tRNA nucleotidyltransferase (CCA-adding enzyme)
MNGDPPAARIPPPRFLAEGTAAAVLGALPGARAVGGCVRDAVAGTEVHDLDIAAPLAPEAIAGRLRAAGLKVFETGLSHGTVTAVLDRSPVEVTALRRDVVTDGRHAEVAWTTDWREDAARRDFTINAMSCDAAGNLWDYFGGRDDLATGRVRFVGDPATRLREDFLRALRFFRFWARYGRGAPDPAALEAIVGAAEGLRRRIAPERVWMELKRLLEAPDPVGALRLMEETGIRAAVLPEGADPGALHAALPPDPLLRLAAIVPRGAAAGELPGRLRWSREEAGRFAAARELAGLREAASEAGLRRLLAARGPEAARDAAYIAEAWGEPGAWPDLRARIAAAAVPVFPLHGRDLLALGVPPGPEMGRVLAGLRARWMEGGCTATRTDLLAELPRLLASRPRAG